MKTLTDKKKEFDELKCPFCNKSFENITTVPVWHVEREHTLTEDSKKEKPKIHLETLFDNSKIENSEDRRETLVDESEAKESAFHTSSPSRCPVTNRKT